MADLDPGQMSPIRQLIARNIRFLLAKRDITAPVLAKKAGVSEKTMNNIVRAGHNTRIGNVEKVAEAFGLEAWHLLCFDMEATPLDHVELRRLYEIYARADTQRRQALMTVAATLDVPAPSR